MQHSPLGRHPPCRHPLPDKHPLGRHPQTPGQKPPADNLQQAPPPPGRHPPLGRHTPPGPLTPWATPRAPWVDTPQQTPPGQKATAADSMHPTGMHSWYPSIHRVDTFSERLVGRKLEFSANCINGVCSTSHFHNGVDHKVLSLIYPVVNSSSSVMMVINNCQPLVYTFTFSFIPNMILLKRFPNTCITSE